MDTGGGWMGRIKHVGVPIKQRPANIQQTYASNGRTHHYHHLQHYIAAGGLAQLVALATVIGSVYSATSFRVCFCLLLLTLA